MVDILYRDKPEWVQYLMDRAPSKRIGEPHELRGAFVWLAPAACKNNEDSPPATTEDRMGAESRRATDPRRSTQPRAEPTPSADAGIAAKYSVCIGLVNAGNWDRFRTDCVTDDFVMHEVDGRDIRGPDGLIQQLGGMKVTSVSRNV